MIGWVKIHMVVIHENNFFFATDKNKIFKDKEREGFYLYHSKFKGLYPIRCGIEIWRSDLNNHTCFLSKNLSSVIRRVFGAINLIQKSISDLSINFNYLIFLNWLIIWFKVCPMRTRVFFFPFQLQLNRLMPNLF